MHMQASRRSRRAAARQTAGYGSPPSTLAPPVPTIRSARRLRGQAANVVHEVPHLLRGELAPETLHLELRTDAVSNGPEDLPVGHLPLPGYVGEVARMRSRRSLRAVSHRAVAMAETAVFLIQLLPRRHRLGAARHRILKCFGGRIAVGLGPGGNRNEDDEDEGQKNDQRGS